MSASPDYPRPPAEPHLAQNDTQRPANWKWRRLRGRNGKREGGQGGGILGRLGRRKSKGKPLALSCPATVSQRPLSSVLRTQVRHRAKTEKCQKRSSCR